MTEFENLPTGPRPGTTTPAGPTTVPAAAPPRGLHPFAKVALYLVGYVVVLLAISVALAMVGAILTGMGVIELPALGPEAASLDVENAIQVLAPYLLPLAILSGLYTLAYTWAFMRLVDRKPLASLGLRFRAGWFGDFVKGGGLAILVLAIIFAFSLITGSIRIEGLTRPAPETTSVFAYLLGALVGFFFVGLYEEIMFRGYVLQRLAERAGRAAAVIVSSVIFAFLHVFNPGSDPFGIFNTIIIGVLLSVLYFRTRSLWMPVGFHFAWNFFLGYVYSLPVSGLPLHGLLEVTEVDPGSRLSGGSYGPEAGLACTIALAIWGAWLIWRRTGRRSRKGS
jgi:membrane protease YdiL (CAAX protease family)